MCTPAAEKTLKPLHLGGVIGGQKFLAKNILFKVISDEDSVLTIQFATDEYDLYGSDEIGQYRDGFHLIGKQLPKLPVMISKDLWNISILEYLDYAFL